MRIIFAGGGTAGHVNPAIAAADYIRAREDGEALFCGGTGNIEEGLVKKAGYEIVTFPLKGLSRSLSPKGIVTNIKAAANTVSAVSGCKKVIADFRPDVVMGTGGYASYPMVAAAAKMGVKTAILEVNATPGVSTKRLAKRADKIMISYESTRGLLPHGDKVVLTGLPVKEGFFQNRGERVEPLFGNGLNTVFCFWGSVGALHMNKKMLDFLMVLAKRRDFNMLYGAGANHIGMMRDELEKRGLNLDECDNIDLRDYIYDMDKVMHAADLVICRAGGTLAELCASGRPSIIVPSPWVAENHQEKNARVLEKAGAAVVMLESAATGEEIYTEVLKLLHRPEKLRQMGEAANRLAQPQALEKIYETLKKLTAAPSLGGAT